MKRSRLKAKPRPDEDKVSPAVADYIFRRDGGCMAPMLDRSADLCRDTWGNVIARSDRRGLTLQHVWHDYSVKAKRAPSDRWHLIVICVHHHLNGWATSHANLTRQREYLVRKEGQP